MNDANRTAHGYYELRPIDVVGRDDLFLVDVRDEEELLGEVGHIHGVHHITATDVQAAALSALAPETKVVMVCRNGRKSAACATFLAKQGHFREVYLLVGGMVRWVGEDRPIARTKTWR